MKTKNWILTLKGEMQVPLKQCRVFRAVGFRTRLTESWSSRYLATSCRMHARSFKIIVKTWIAIIKPSWLDICPRAEVVLVTPFLSFIRRDKGKRRESPGSRQGQPSYFCCETRFCDFWKQLFFSFALPFRAHTLHCIHKYNVVCYALALERASTFGITCYPARPMFMQVLTPVGFS